MTKNLSWKQSLLIAFICYGLKFSVGTYLPSYIVAIFEIVGFIALVSGIFSGIKVILTKNKHQSNK